MPQVASWDYPNRRFYLAFDTVANGVDFAAAYLEERAYREASGGDVRGQRPMMSGEGFAAKGGGKRTERYVLLLDGARPVPYDTSHTLVMLVEPITKEENPDDALSGADVFDRSPLSPSSNVNIDVGYSQVEVITVSGGSGLDATQSTQLSNLHSRLTDTRAGHLDDIPAAATQATVAASNTNTLLSRITAARTAALDLLQGISDRALNITKALGREPGISVTQKDPTDEAPGYLRAGDIRQVITKNEDGSVTVENES